MANYRLDAKLNYGLNSWAGADRQDHHGISHNLLSTGIMFEGKKEVMLALSYSLRYLLISKKDNLKKKNFQTDGKL